MAHLRQLTSRMVIALVLLAASVAGASAASQHHIFSEKQAKFLAIGPALDSGAHDGTIAWNDEETGAIINKPQPWSDTEDDRPPMLHRASNASTLTILPVVLLPFVFDLLTLSVPQHFSIDSTAAEWRPTSKLVETPHKTGPPSA